MIIKKIYIIFTISCVAGYRKDFCRSTSPAYKRFQLLEIIEHCWYKYTVIDSDYMNDSPPKFEDIVCVTDDVIFAAEMSSLKNRRGYYFPVLDSPRMKRPDASNEIVRRTNAISKIQPQKVILSGLDKKSKEGFYRRIPRKKLAEIDNATAIDSELIGLTQKIKKELHWGPQRLSVGLLKAKQSRCHLRIDLEESPNETYVPGEGNHLVVFEERDDVSSVIAANYAFSIGAALSVIPPVSEEETENILEDFYLLYTKDTGKSISEKIDRLRSRIRNHAECLDIRNVNCITFITNGLPWGFAYPEIPNTHIFSYPDMGTFLIEAIVAEQKNSPGVRVALMVDPSDDRPSEIGDIIDYLRKQGIYIRFLSGRAATALNVEYHLITFPYDLLVISTHAGEIDGMRLTYHYNDSEGIARELVVEQSTAFGIKPGSELIRVQEFTRFVSLDGVDWNDPEKDQKLHIGSAITDYWKKKDNPENEDLKLISKVHVSRVKLSMALRMYDDNLLFMFHLIADHNTPVILNNACSSWREMGERFIFAGARAYIGTMFEVTDVEAKEIAINFFLRYCRRPLVFALWRTQKQIYPSMRHPYVMIGPHFVKLRFEKIHAIKYLIDRISQAVKGWREHGERSVYSDVKKNCLDYADFLEKELKKLIEKWQ